MSKRKPMVHAGHDFEDMKEVAHYARHMEKFSMSYKDFMKRLKSLDFRGPVLDIGAGPGVLTARVADSFPEVEITALERSRAMAEYGREYVRKKGVGERVRYVVGDAMDSELIGSLGKFGLVYCTYVLHNFEDAGMALGNFLEAADEGGTVFIYDFRRVWWVYYTPFKGGLVDSVKAAYQPSEVRAILGGLGIREVEIVKGFPFTQSVVFKRG